MYSHSALPPTIHRRYPHSSPTMALGQSPSLRRSDTPVHSWKEPIGVADLKPMRRSCSQASISSCLPMPRAHIDGETYMAQISPVPGSASLSLQRPNAIHPTTPSDP